MSRLFQSVPLKLPLVGLAALAVLTACGTSQPKYQQELFNTGATPFSRSYNTSTADACEAARRALLNQGYLTNASRPDTVEATRDFQPTSDLHVTVEFHVTCTPGEDADNSSVIYANAVQSGYTLKKSATSASVGLSVLGSLSVPIHSNSDAMVKVSSETIQTSKFYDGFFDIVGRYLRTVVKTEAVPVAAISANALPLPPTPTPALPITPAPLATAASSAASAASAPGAASSPATLSTPFIEAAKAADAPPPASQPAALPGPIPTSDAAK